MVVGLLLGSPYLAIHLLKERLAPLVALLVIAHQLQLLYRETVEALGDLIHVHIVVALYREYGRLRRPLSALDGGTRSGADRPGRGAQQVRGRLREGAQPLPGAPCGLLGARPVAGEGVVEELRVGLDGLPRQRLPRLLLPGCLLGELLSVCAAGLGLLPEVLGHELGELLGASLLALSRLGGLPVDDPVRVGESLGESGGRLIDVLSPSSVHHVLRSFPRDPATKASYPSAAAWRQLRRTPLIGTSVNKGRAPSRARGGAGRRSSRR